MEDIKRKQCADFLHIAQESIETGDTDVAIDFIEDVIEHTPSYQAEELEDAVDMLENGKTDAASDIIEDVITDLTNDM